MGVDFCPHLSRSKYNSWHERLFQLEDNIWKYMYSSGGGVIDSLGDSNLAHASLIESTQQSSFSKISF